MTTSDYYPNTTNCTAYKKTQLTSGNNEYQTPDQREITPASFTTEFSEAEKDTVSTDDDNYVEVSINIVDGFTARGSIMIKYVISEDEGVVTQLYQLLRGAATGRNKIRKLYIWNHVTSSWLYLGDDITLTTKETHESTVSSNLSDYIDTDTIYFLFWDYAGDYYSGEGCFEKGTKVIMSDGSLKSIEKIKIDDKILGWDTIENKLKESTVLMKGTYEKKMKFPIYVVKGEGFELRATGNHKIDTKEGEMTFEELKKGYSLFQLNKDKLEPVKIEDIEIESNKEVYDIKTTTRNLFVEGNILVHNLRTIMKW